MTAEPLRLASLLALAVPAALLGGALIAEHGFGLPPCEMCWWQRYPHILAVALAVSALLAGRAATARMLVMSAALAILVSGLIGGFHAGVEYGWWSGLTRCTASGVGGGNALDAILNAPLVRCDAAPWTLFGISLAGFNFLISLTAAMVVLVLALPRLPHRKGLA